MIIPLGHEQTSVRRLPWVTFAIIGLCIVAFVLSIVPERHALEEANRLFQEIVGLFVADPELDLDPAIEKMFFGSLPDDQGQRDAFREYLKEMAPQAEAMLPLEMRDGLAGESSRAIRQGELDRLTEQFWAALHGSPNYQLGLIPAHMTAHGFVTHMFMHAGWLHLFGNLFFLFLAGPFIEDVWGRPLFAAFYLASGLVAALAYAARFPGFEGSLIGASGAIAGVMGAFLIRFWKTKIKFFYWFGFFVGTFEAAAWIMLPLWFLREFFTAQAMEVLIPGENGGGVAYWAHVWGFAFGMVVAVAVSYFRIEDRFIHSTIESKITVVDNTAVEQAMGLAAAGN
ncbi:MAG: rhomboid family intramembrane serine protease, partial [Thermoanaerobaculales bacterium]